MVCNTFLWVPTHSNCAELKNSDQEYKRAFQKQSLDS